MFHVMRRTIPAAVIAGLAFCSPAIVRADEPTSQQEQPTSQELLEQIKQLFGVDLVEKLQEWSGKDTKTPANGKAAPAPINPPRVEPVVSVEHNEPASHGNKPRKDRKVIRIEPGPGGNDPGFDIEIPERG